MEETKENLLLNEEHGEKSTDKESKKARKRKPKNKYKELNLQQQKASGRLDEANLQKQPEKIAKENEVACSRETKKQKNRKRKHSEHPKSYEEENASIENQNPLAEGNPPRPKKLKTEKSPGPVLPEPKPARKKFGLAKLRQVLQRSAKPESDEIKTAEEDRTEVIKPEAVKPKSGKKKKKKKELEASPVEPQSLRERIVQKLASARFRYINESLYGTTSEGAVDLFKEDEEAFRVYHEGYSAQVSKWPVNPVDRMISYIDSKEAGLVVADFGCGEAKIARTVRGKIVHSFDLAALNEHVTVCDMSKTPLPKGSVDLAVFCLSLMGTNLVDYLCEANRVLKNRGILLVAEVVSRFEKVGDFVRKMKKLGFNAIDRDESNKMFVWFEFEKVGNPPKKNKLPKIELSSCVYKRR